MCSFEAMKHLISCLFSICLFSTFSFAQTSQIRGTVTSITGEPLVGATVFIPNLRVGAYTNEKGIFSIDKIKGGSYTVLAVYYGYDTLRQTVSVQEGKVTTVSFPLQLREVFTEAVEISAEGESGKIETKEVKIASIQVTPKQISLIPSIGTPDLAQYLQVLPGVVFTGDQGGQLYIRGGTPIQNMTLLDGMIIYAPFHSIGLFSVFDPGYIRTADVYSAGFGAQYGGRVSSVMDIQTRNGNFKDYRGSLNLTPFSNSLLLEGPLVRSKKPGAGTSFLLSARNNLMDRTTPTLYPYIDNGASRKSVAGVPFGYVDTYGKITMSDGTNYANFFGFQHTDHVNYGFPANYNWKSNGGGFNFQLLPTGAAAIITGNFGYSGYRTNLAASSEAFPRTSGISGFNGGLNISYILNRIDEASVGAYLMGFKTDYMFTNAFNVQSKYAANNTELAFYSTYKKVIQQKNVSFSKRDDKTWDRAVIEPSLRFHYYNNQLKFSVEPRIRAKLNFQRVSLSAAAGHYTQNLVAAASDRDVVNLFQGFLSAPEGELANATRGDNLQAAQHALLGAEFELLPRLTTSIEGWAKRFSQLSNTNRNKLFPEDPDFITETGLARGLDFILKYNTPELYLYATYGLSKSTRNDFKQTYFPVFDRRHNLNFVGSYKIGRFGYYEGAEGRKMLPKFKEHRWEFNVRWNLGSGFPFTQTQGFYEKLSFTNNGSQSNYLNQNGSLNLILSDQFNGGRLPYYHRLDVAIKRKWVIRNSWMIEATGSVINAYDRRNIFYIDRILFEKVYQFPILPSFGLAITY